MREVPVRGQVAVAPQFPADRRYGPTQFRGDEPSKQPGNDSCPGHSHFLTTQITNAQITDLCRPIALDAQWLWGGSSNTLGHLVAYVADDTVALLNAAQIFIDKSNSLTRMAGTGNILTNPYKFSA